MAGEKNPSGWQFCRCHSLSERKLFSRKVSRLPAEAARDPTLNRRPAVDYTRLVFSGSLIRCGSRNGIS